MELSVSSLLKWELKGDFERLIKGSGHWCWTWMLKQCMPKTVINNVANCGGKIKIIWKLVY